MRTMHQMLRITRMEALEHFHFSLLEFRFFSESEGGVAMPFPRHSPLLYRLVLIPYILIAEVMFFRTQRYYVTLDGTVAGLFAIRVEPDSIYIASLAVAKTYHRLGIATHILQYVEECAVRLGRRSVELRVLKTNAPAQRLYLRSGFYVTEQTSRSLIMEKRVSVGSWQRKS